jgi:hypothetical protein
MSYGLSRFEILLIKEEVIDMLMNIDTFADAEEIKNELDKIIDYIDDELKTE